MIRQPGLGGIARQSRRVSNTNARIAFEYMSRKFPEQWFGDFSNVRPSAYAQLIREYEDATFDRSDTDSLQSTKKRGSSNMSTGFSMDSMYSLSGNPINESKMMEDIVMSGGVPTPMTGGTTQSTPGSQYPTGVNKFGPLMPMFHSDYSDADQKAHWDKIKDVLKPGTKSFYKKKKSKKSNWNEKGLQKVKVAKMDLLTGNVVQTTQTKRNWYKGKYYKMKKLYDKMKRQRTKQNKAWTAIYGPRGVAGSERQKRFGATWTTADADQKQNRLLHNYYGKGDYKDWLKYASRGVGGVAGGALGWMNSGWGGLSAGAKSGWDQGASFSKYMGWGDYGVSGNQLMDAVGQNSQQRISVNASDNTGDVYMSHTEFVQNITVSTTAGQTQTPFAIQAFDLNPGIGNSFPFLSQLAANYELYDWHGLIFHYKPTSGEFGASAVSNALGKVVMATKYGVTQTTPFANCVEMQNYDYANSAKPSCGMIHGIETDNRSNFGGNMLVVRTEPPVESRLLYDLGRFYVATEGVPLAASSTAVIGELWVTYRVRLSRAKLFTAIGDSISYNVIQFNPIPAAFLNGVLPIQGTLGATVTPDVATPTTSCLLNLPSSIQTGRYYVQVNYNGAAAAFAGNPQCTLITSNLSLFASRVTTPTPSSTATCNCFGFTVTNPNSQPIQLRVSIASANTLQFMINVTEVDPQFFF